MVANLDMPRGLIQELEWQDVGASRSFVRPVSCPVDPMRRYAGGSFAPRDARVAARLRELQRLLEWAYGYREPRDARQRQTRRAPSAGALYPTENFVVVETGHGWQVLFYDYAGHRFYPVPVADADGVAQALALEHGEEAILFASVLWRTVQRYGVRGYRYCLLDAAHVASNLARAALAVLRPVALDVWSPTAGLETLLGLDHGEALLLAARTRPGPLPVPAPPEPLPVSKAHAKTTEQPPRFSPVLQRAAAFHRRTLVGPGHGTAVPWPGQNDTPDDLHAWAEERCSARDFTGAPVTAEAYACMAEAAVRARAVLRQHTPALQVFAIAPRVQGLPAGSGLLGSERGNDWSSAGRTAHELSETLSAACQNQGIMKGSSFAFVVAAGKGELAAHGHAGYRPLVLNAGFLCADLYREAARCSLGTTSIGGFSDDAVSQVLGDPSLTPVVIQAFGVMARSGDKADAARIVGEARIAAAPPGLPGAPRCQC